MRLLVFSATRLFADCVVAGLEQHSEIDTCQGLCCPWEVIDFLVKNPDHALLADLSADKITDNLLAVRERVPEALILGLAVAEKPEEVLRCAKLGCVSIIPHDSSIDRTVAIIRRARRGEVTCTPAAAGALMREIARGNASSKPKMPSCLTRRETEICALVSEGRTNKEIARELDCREGTVKNHVHSILSKLNVSRRSAVLRTLQEGDRATR